MTQVSGGTFSSRNPKDKIKSAVRMTISGSVYRGDDQLVQGLTDTINHDPHMRATVTNLKSGAPAGLGSRKASEDFTLKVEVGKQPASKYTTRLVPPGRGEKPGPQ